MGFNDDFLPIIVALWEIFKSVIFYPFPKRRRELRGEVALVTGAGSGLGAGVAKLLSKKGCTVICWDMNEDGNQKTVDEIRSTGGEAYGFKVDVTKRAVVYEAAKKSENLAGNITILVNNAGIVGGKNFLDSSDEKIQATFEVNAISHIWTTKAILPSMLANDHGNIVSIASSAGYFGVPKLADYCASKAAAAHFAASLDAELYKLGSKVVITSVCPYAINTGMFEGFQATRSWLINILSPEYVIEQIVYSIETNAGLVYLPKILHTFSVLQTLFPRNATVALMKWAGVLDAMNNFTGRTPESKKLT